MLRDGASGDKNLLFGALAKDFAGVQTARTSTTSTAEPVKRLRCCPRCSIRDDGEMPFQGRRMAQGTPRLKSVGVEASLP